MTVSQESIYRRLYEQARLQLVWGPPGAGMQDHSEVTPSLARGP